jgi:hypothetical protein
VPDPITAPESEMPATYTFDVVHPRRLRLLRGWRLGPFWGRGGPDLLDHRLATYSEEQRMVLGANTYGQFVELLGASTEAVKLDPLKRG